jgi:hypothetical protein
MLLIGFILLIFLIIFSIFDVNAKKIPSVILTGAIFVMAFIYFDNIYFAVLSFILGYMFYEFGFFGSIADVKTYTLIGFYLNSYNGFFVYMLSVMLIGGLWISYYGLHFNNPKGRKKIDPKIPFTFIFLISFIILEIAGVFYG